MGEPEVVSRSRQLEVGEGVCKGGVHVKREPCASHLDAARIVGAALDAARELVRSLGQDPKLVLQRDLGLQRSRRKSCTFSVI